LSRAARKAGTAGSEGTPARQRAGVTRRNLLLRHPKESRHPNDFTSLSELSTTLLGFVDRYNQTAQPFSWKFTAADLHNLMDRMRRHEQKQPPQDKPAPQAA
jgi:hypothetical protein